MNNGYYKTKTILLLTLCTCLLQSGCMVGPDYKAPEPNAPANWAGQAGPQGAESPEKILLQWWTEFNDPNLTSLIERAMKSNLDLKLAEERIHQARATLGVVEAPFWPTADVTAAQSRTRTGGPVVTKRNLFKAGLDAAWEMDIFGGTRRNIEAAEADIQASIEDRRDVLVTLASEVALNYVQLRGFQQEIIIAQNNLKSQQQSADVVRKRFEGGFISSLDVANADAQVATTLSQIPLIEASAQQSIYNIGVLLGQEPESLLEELSPASSIPVTPPEVPTGLPSEMLRRRPDIRAAEAQIHSATAQIGVATADLVPQVQSRRLRLRSGRQTCKIAMVTTHLVSRPLCGLADFCRRPCLVQYRSPKGASATGGARLQKDRSYRVAGSRKRISGIRQRTAAQQSAD